MMIAGTHHGADRAAGHVGDQAPEESLLGQVRVVRFQQVIAGTHELGGEELEPTGFEPGDYFAG